eukprot:CAMPEP_0184737828 /NCGR_PEP_ID=MMETSP0315-20130426/597_1 /TAXON_ID=101924 /ORGANISM="Rhodosorus marinus, Strain UTEX LB 2760" /LENGTH=46 /DNA_ID= /DNA_START= /DNA_END= /DNA_ORIENTATION=
MGTPETINAVTLGLSHRTNEAETDHFLHRAGDKLELGGLEGRALAV